MSLTLKDVVENQMRLRASGLRRDAADPRSAGQSGRERFAVDASERPATQTRHPSDHADATKTRGSRADPPGRQDDPARAKSGTEAKPEAKQADRPDAPRKPTGPGQPGKTQGAADAQRETAETSKGELTAEGLGTSDAAGGEPAPASAPEASALPDTSSIIALFVSPPAAAPPPPPATTLGGGDAMTEDASEIETDQGATKGAATSDLKPGAASNAAGTAKPEFQAMLGDAAAAAQPDAAQQVAAPAADAVAAAGAPAASSAPTEAKAAAAAHQQAAATPAAAPVPLGAVPMTIGLRALGESNRFEIRLDPKELGRIDVSIDIDKQSGTVGARLVVDRPETLALLQRDASSLQQALSQTGLDASAGIALSLRGDGTGQGNGNAFGANGQQHGASQSDRTGQQAGTDQTPIDLVPLRSLAGLGRVDIRI
ncbi:flagellar hook-length control protein FliK [Methylobacterium gnaphalii]|uniref:Flagellar hook-length control protein n=1 Tax=Methylobacterium gnaphalii TaxID=1010610 RepID=A0A512JFF5_9HYPH|nr:flagellar hook-length control protein FliK [Methylobacterium gnaphalii]GEP08681.1 flagellar hook-length control protein [Methylobacterium gnaphalii]GJD69705.1 hypothetical protein MMMDOFMJ_2642 [Methylobacterium gnaphalii]GLS47448.1 flagellar hook-length control protein [Methylobacterium gnaphalii]